MRKAAIGIAAVGALIGTPGLAADMVVKAAPVSAATYTWAGWYVGANAGYGFGGASGNGITSFSDVSGVGFATYNAVGGFQFPNVNPSGAVGGFQAGYTWQTTNWVWGVVTDFDFSGMKASGTVNVPAIGTFFPQVQSSSAQINWFGTLRGRVGYALGNWQPYVTGGLAYGRVSGSLNEFVPTTGFLLSGSSSAIKAGWAIGGGFDYALTRQWTAGVEYVYFDLGNNTVTGAAQNIVPPTNTVSVTQRFTGQILRAVVNYRF